MDKEAGAGALLTKHHPPLVLPAHTLVAWSSTHRPCEWVGNQIQKKKTQKGVECCRQTCQSRGIKAVPSAHRWPPRLSLGASHASLIQMGCVIWSLHPSRMEQFITDDSNQINERGTNPVTGQMQHLWRSLQVSVPSLIHASGSCFYIYISIYFI